MSSIFSGDHPNYGVWLDSLGYSWDPNYFIGDNKKENLWLSFSSFISSENFLYSLDFQENISLSEDLSLTMPDDGLHTLILYGTDIFGHTFRSETRKFVIDQGFLPPKVKNIQVSEDPLIWGDVQVITCEAYHLFGIQSVTTYIEHPDGAILATLPMTNSIDDIYQTAWDSTCSPEGSYFVDIEAYDTTGNYTFINNGITFELIPRPHKDVISVGLTHASSSSMGTKLKYDDGSKLRISRSGGTTAKSLYDFDYGWSAAWAYSQSGSPSSGMASWDGIYYSQSCTGDIFWVRSIDFWQIIKFNLGSSWKNTYYMEGLTLRYRVKWDTGNDPTYQGYSKLYIYNYQTSSWEAYSGYPFARNAWIYDTQTKTNTGALGTFNDKYISSSGVIQFKFWETTYDNKWYHWPEHYLTWDYMRLDVSYLYKQSQVQINFDSGVLNGLNDFYLRFQGQTNQGTATFKVNGVNQFTFGTTEKTVGTCPNLYQINNVNSIIIDIGTAKYIDLDYLYLLQLND